MKYDKPELNNSYIENKETKITALKTPYRCGSDI